jgi:PAS domain S-box-containing protein
MKILYIEDSPGDSDLTRRELSANSPETQLNIVNSVHDAAMCLKHPEEYDLVLLDMQLPDGDGLDLLTDIRLQNLPLAVVLITGQGDEASAVAALKGGADDYIVKRDDYLSRLLITLEDALHRFRARSTLRSHPLKILYVERNKIDIDLTRRHFKQHAVNIRLTTVKTADEALDKLAADEWDVLLLDYQLPGINALELIKIIRQERQNTIPIVLVTGQGDEEIALQALKLGASDYVNKGAGYLYKLPGLLENAYTHAQFTHKQNELIKSEERFRLLADYTYDWEYWINPDGDYDYISPSVERITGYSTQEFMSRPDLLFEIVRPDYAEKIQAHLQEEKDLNQPVMTMEFPILNQNGKTIWLAHYCTAIFDAQGKYLGRRGNNRDITKRKQMALALEKERNQLAQNVEMRTEELRLANTELMRVLQTKDEFLANMSHELRTPLTSILGLSELLEMGVRGPLNQEQIESIRTIYQSGEHLLTLINDILDLSKIEAGKFEIEPGFVPVEDICQSGLSLIQGMAYSKGITISYQLSDPQLKIWADARRLKQILVNLLSNAVKFTPEGGQVSLEVDLQREQQRVRFIVQDTGIGISQENMDKLFEPFTQLDATLSRKYEGSGLGLALVRKLADLHQGKVFVESEGIPGKGSRFTVSLPWNDSPISRSGSSPDISKSLFSDDKTHNSIIEPESTARYTILLAEDNLSNIMILSEYLEKYDYQIIQALDGKEAIEKADKFLPDLILMDIQMPIMDGLEAIRYLRQDTRFIKTPIMALTALAMPGDLEHCLEAGATDYVTKPVKMKELLGKIKELLNSKE